MDSETPMHDRRWYALAGFVAGAAGLAGSVATGWALNTTSPVIAVAEFVRDHTPGPLAIKLVHLVKHLDKPLLITSTAIVMLALAVGLGLLARRHPNRAEFGVVVIGALGLWAVLLQPHTGVAAVIAVFVGLLAWILLLRTLVMKAPVEVGQRRDFLVIVGGVAVVSGLALWLGRAVDAGTRAVEAARAKLRLAVTSGVEPANATVDVPGIEAWRTSADNFYRIDTALSIPAIEPSSWSIRIHGMVDRELRITYDQLIARKFSEGWVTLCCVSNPVGGNLISNAYFSGVLVRDLLKEAGVHSGADAVLQTSYDGWTCGTPIGALTDDRMAILAVAMNGQPLPLEHGFPVRTVVPGLYGYVSATKWVVDMEVTQFSKFQAYWTERGWSQEGPVKTESRIDVPSNGGRVHAGSDGMVGIGGVAWAQHTGIQRVEVQVDGGPWQQAQLGGVPDNDTWVQWGLRVPLKSGSHQVAVRATDKSGYTQTPVQHDVVPNGATGWDAVGFSVA
ncbi:MAG TPA: molybdopterin-dependent oxidoreductase [Marmoricola sp.]|nr:molybdopterin-dependent oxidoreductase [Marmoricola sp.]